METFQLIIFFLMVLNCVSGKPDGYTSLQFGTNVCFYVSNNPIWPYDTTSSTDNNAAFNCSKMNLNLAVINSDAERTALWNLFQCQMGSIFGNNDYVHVSTSTAITPTTESGKKCTFIKTSDGTVKGEDTRNCVNNNGKQVYYVCRKNAPCTQSIDSCYTDEGGKMYCYKNPNKYTTWADADQTCQSYGGHLPVVLLAGKQNYLKTSYGSGNIWIALKSDTSGGTSNCAGDSCVNANQWYWSYSSTLKNPLESYQINAVGKAISVTQQKHCMYIPYPNLLSWTDTSCGDNKYAVCEFDNAGLSPTETADNYDNKLVCPSPTIPPAANMFNITYRDWPMCPGGIAKYECNAGGINAFKTDITLSSLVLKCLPSFTYENSPSAWPECVPFLNCPEPFNDPVVMKYDWTAAKGTAPNLTIDYSCVWPKKMIISKSDLTAQIDDNVMTNLTTKCTATGVYSIDMSTYSCTKPCPLPRLSEPLLMTHNWTNTTENAEYKDVIKFTCRFGKKYVLKSDFAIGSSANLLPELTASCLISGWFNESVGSYTCVKDCGPPTNYSSVMTNNWDQNLTVVPYGKTYKYTCNDPTKKVIDLNNPQNDLLDNINTTCLVNGKYSIDVTNYGCIDCDRPINPANGKFECSSSQYKENSICVLVCDTGYIVATKTSMTCLAGATNGSFAWSVQANEFSCVKACHLVAGGQVNGTKYFDNVEVFCPSDPCNNAPFASLPFGVIGSISAFTNGLAFICGGARTVYADCTAKSSGNYCNRNADCISSTGGTSWCTGPKISDCFIYDRYLTRSWTKSDIGLLKPRAYAASVLLPDGRVWLLGGAGSSSVLKTTEFIEANENKISKITGGPDMPEPLMGHCAAMLTLSGSQVLVLGGFSSIVNDYQPLARFYDFSTSQWTTENSMTLGGRLDTTCMNANIRGSRQVMIAGGWNNLALKDTGFFSRDTNKWVFLNGTGASSPLPLPLRSSTLIERNQTSILLGGVSCDSKGRNCKQTDTIMKLDTSAGGFANWVEIGHLSLARSSHTALTVPRTLISRC